MRFTFLLVVLFVTCGLLAQDDRLATGHATRLATNRLDIQHRRNDELRARLMQDAVQDALERAAPVEVRSSTRSSVHERRSSDRNHFTDDFEQRSVQRSRIAWQRSGDFHFQRDPKHYRQWVCTVLGTVRELPVAEELDPGRLALSPARPTVTRKRGATLQLSWEGMERPKPGDVLESHRSGRAGQADGGVQRVTGQLVVTEVNERSATARLVRGYWTARPNDLLRRADVGVLRGGLQLRYSMDADPMLPTASDVSVPRSVQSISVDFFEHSLLQRWEISAGLEVLSDRSFSTDPIMGLLPHIALGRPFALLPEVLYLTPTLGGGYGLLSSAYPAPQRSMPFFFDGLLEASLRLGALEFRAGVRYRNMLGNEHLSGLTPNIGLRLDIYRMTHFRAEGRQAPGLGSGLHAITSAAGRLHGR